MSDIVSGEGCLISIIIPAYNAERYIVECLDSLLRRKPPSIEIIVVDDGSKDDTVNLIKSKFDYHISIGEVNLLIQQNFGVSVARNSGISVARGRYIGFVDADDLVSDNYFEVLVRAINAHETDIIEFGFYNVDGESRVVAGTGGYTQRNFGLLLVKDALVDVYADAVFYPVCRLYRRQLLEKNPVFPVGVRFCEDMMALANIYESAVSIYGIRDLLYGYRINPEGATLNIRTDYFDNVRKFYISRINDNTKPGIMLKAAMRYVLYTCKHRMGLSFDGKEFGLLDYLRLLCSVDLYKKHSWRRIFIIIMPKLWHYISDMRSRFGSNKV